MEGRKKRQAKHKTKLIKSLQAQGIYNVVDDSIHEHAALCLALIEEAESIAGEHMQVFPTGATQIAPEINNLRGLLKDWIAYADVLGLSPRARKRLEIIEEKPKEQSALVKALFDKPPKKKAGNE
jgi:phage terminase small subunit